MHTVAVNKKLTFRFRCNDRTTMRIVLKKRLQHEKSHAVYTVRAWAGHVGYKGGNRLTRGEKRTSLCIKRNDRIKTTILVKDRTIE